MADSSDAGVPQPARIVEFSPGHGGQQVPRVVHWGRAESGEVVAVAVPVDDEPELLNRWPALGLEDLVEDPNRVDRVVTLDPPVGVGGGLVWVDGVPVGASWERLESDLALFAAERLAGKVAVHAGVIVHGGRAILLPGTSGAGKSTLCIAAHEAGATVLTDEYALVDPASGLVTGWRRSVRRRLPGGGVERLDLAVPHDPVPVGLVALLVHDAEAGDAWETVSPAEITLGLMANTVCAQSRPDESFDAALIIGRSAAGVAGTRGDAAAAVRRLFDLLDGA